MYFDEMHMEQYGGPLNTDGNQIRFPRTGGVFNREGQYAMMLYCPVYKYPDQAWYCLRVAKVTLLRRMAKVFDYTCKKMVTLNIQKSGQGANHNGIWHSKEGTVGWGGTEKKCHQLQLEKWVYPSVRILVGENRRSIVDRCNASLDCDIEGQCDSDNDSNTEEYK